MCSSYQTVERPNQNLLYVGILTALSAISYIKFDFLYFTVSVKHLVLWSADTIYNHVLLKMRCERDILSLSIVASSN